MKRLPKIFCLLVFPLIANTLLYAQVEFFKPQQVQLLPGVFKTAETTDLKYILALDPDRLLAPFQREAGLASKASSYTNWENTGLDGHIGGHYLSALALMYSVTGNKEVEKRLTYMVNELKKCQDKFGDGYVGAVPGSKALWEEVFKGNVAAQNRKWVPLYNIHKVYAGLRDAYLYAGNQVAKYMLISYSDWFVKLSTALGKQKMEEMLRTEHGGINEVLADVYGMTGEKKYLDAAYSFSHQAILNPLKSRQDKLNNLHANTQIPKIIGFKRIAEVNNDSAYNDAASFFWNTVVNDRTVATGGNSVREHFNPANNFTSMVTSEEGPETCNTYNMLKLTKMFYQDEANAKYIDFYERALYNHILSSQLPGKGGFVYFTPMRPGHYRVYSQPQTSMWCCVGSGIENHAKYNEVIYAHNDANVYVNLFIPSRLQWKEKGFTLTQQTSFPESEKTIFTIDQSGSSSITLKIRYPSWVQKGALRVRVNGAPVKVTGDPSAYISLNRRWKKGDKIEVTLPMQTTAEQLPDGLNYVALLHGPIVLAAKTGTDDMPDLFADDSRMGHIAHGRLHPLNKAPMFVSEDDSITRHIVPVPGKPLTFKFNNLVYPEKYQSLKLIPFYNLHESRYVIYWQKETPESLMKIEQKLAEEAEAAAKLAAATVDVVNAGEQQPESDHFIESENSNTGVNKDRHWRDARGWFSYRLNNKDQLATTLRVTYFGRDRNRKFRILINEQLLANVELKGNDADDFYTIDYSLPNDIRQSNGTLRVKFVADEGSVAGGIYEVRLLKQMPK